MSATVRFAPSPTGRLHIGNARTALLNFLFARKHSGKFILRFDDTDLERSSREYADAIEADLAWLQIAFDAVRRQSERIPLYDASARALAEKGLLYPCYETAEELEVLRGLGAQLIQGYLFGRPMWEQDLLAAVEAAKPRAA